LGLRWRNLTLRYPTPPRNPLKMRLKSKNVKKIYILALSKAANSPICEAWM